jgi:hypothetical protein
MEDIDEIMRQLEVHLSSLRAAWGANDRSSFFSSLEDLAEFASESIEEDQSDD